MPSKSPKTCLIVDDTRSMRVMIDNWMTRAGFFCINTPNGQDAKAAIQKKCPDILITDIEMPLLNGLELVCWIRKNSDPKVSELPIVVITSLDDPELEKIVAEIGASFVLRKPLSEVAVARTVMSARGTPYSPGTQQQGTWLRSVMSPSFVRQMAVAAIQGDSRGDISG